MEKVSSTVRISQNRKEVTKLYNTCSLFLLADESKINNMLSETDRNREMCNQIVRRVFTDPVLRNDLFRPFGRSVSSTLFTLYLFKHFSCVLWAGEGGGGGGGGVTSPKKFCKRNFCIKKFLQAVVPKKIFVQRRKKIRAEGLNKNSVHQIPPSSGNFLWS